MLDLKTIKSNATGRWGSIISTHAPSLEDAIKKQGKHVPCPMHGGTDGFRLHHDFATTGGGVCNTCGHFPDGFALLQKVNNLSFTEALKTVRSHLGDYTYTPTTPSPQSNRSQNHKKNIDAILSQTIRINWPVAKYLQNRSLGALAGQVPKDLKSIDQLPYWDNGKITESYPAMICPVRNLSGEIVTLHRTYLTAQGFKANVSSPKKLMPPITNGATSGCAVQLYKPADILALTEGVETALAVHLATDLPVWAAISASMLEKIQIPSNIKTVYIWADKDRSGTGEKSANVLARRLIQQGLTVHILVPQQTIPDDCKSFDWLDAYKMEVGQ